MSIRRFYDGNEPRNGKVYAECDDWILYILSEVNGYINFKLISRRRMLYKANYWLAVNTRNGQLCKTKDFKPLKLMPELKSWVEKVIRERCNET